MAFGNSDEDSVGVQCTETDWYHGMSAADSQDGIYEPLKAEIITHGSLD